MKVFKYNLKLTGNHLLLPEKRKFLHFGVQNEETYVWMLVDSRDIAPRSEWYYQVVGTGHEIGDLDEELYLGTVQQGMFVWHLFGKRH